QGFDFFYGFANTGIDYWTHERYGIPSMFRGNERIKDEGYATDLFAREAVRFIRESRDGPFFLYAAFNAPHSASNLQKDPYQAPEEAVRLYAAPPAPREAVYRAMVTSLDAAVGRILEAVREAGLDASTCVVFTSDNGGSGKASSNGPLRGAKGELYEGGIRVPFLARWPGRLPAGRVSDAVVSALDLFPTLLAWAGVPAPAGVTLDGLDAGPVLAGGPSPGRRLFWEWRGQRAARVGEWKWTRTPTGGGLFDLSKDPGETTDLSAAQPARAAAMESAWAAWKREMEATEPRGPFRDY
ncbi:MAG TPA: sulfatase-like hydrolase/transferase, partial [Planctomycetota bacterium]|nr:sulfatase-like hydrolase/transferase [Planctomycetota bacterium]